MIPEADASMRLDLGTVQNATDKLKLDYSYGTTDNNGNVLSQKITVPTVGQTSGFVATQNYSYDSLNRITQATETVAGSQSWNQQFEYDRYGNRTSFSQTLGGVTTNTTPSVDAATNRFNAGQGFSYDASGNVVQDTDPMTGHVRSFAFDGENKQREVKDVTNSNHVVGTYFYDGDGRRVKKVTDTEATIFIYDAGGKLVAEYSTAAPPATPQVSYTTTDHLGSPRINTDATGGVIARHDYHPFGEEIFTAQRTTGLNYSADSVRKQFTGYERDNETGLDYAQARYYNNQHGRFTSVDPLAASASIKNPQTFNRYTYALNSPYKFTDPLGLLSMQTSGACGNGCPNSDGGMSGYADNYDSGQLNGPQMLELARQQQAIRALVLIALGIRPSVAYEVVYGHPFGQSARSTPRTTPPLPTFRNLWYRHKQNPHDPVTDTRSDGSLLYGNQCAIRLSITFLDSDLRDKFTGFFGSRISKTKEGYVIRALDMKGFLDSVFGLPRDLTRSNDRGGEINNLTGFVLLVNFRGTVDTDRFFNHVDMWNRQVLGFGDFNWLQRAEKMFFWEYPVREAVGRAK